MTDYVVSGGQTSSGLTISAGDTLTVSSGGFAISMTIDAGGSETVSSGGIDFNSIVNGGGVQVIDGVAVGTTIGSGGSETISSDGSVADAMVSAGGMLVVEAGGSATFTILSGSMLVFGVASATSGLYGTMTVESGGLAVATSASDEPYGGIFMDIASGGVGIDSNLGIGLQTVEAGATAISATLTSFYSIQEGHDLYGEQLVYGVASGTVDEGTIIVEPGGLEIGGTEEGPIGEYVYGTASGTTIGGTQFVESGGLAVGATVLNDGFQVVYGVASATILFGGFSSVGVAQQWIEAGGVAIGAIVSGQGSQTIDVGGLAIGGNVSAQGSQIIDVGGVASGTTVYSGGLQIVGNDFQNFPDALASGTTVSSGGQEIVSFGGMSIATAILSGGIETVYSGGIAMSSVIAGSGALLDVQGSISGGVTFEGSGGLLEFDGAVNSGFTIYGLAPADSIDIPGLAFTSITTATLLPGNVLQVTNNINASADLQLDPAQNFTGDIFAVSPDSVSGTLITEENPCFLRGTLILTPAGEVAVETLHIGDLVTTAAGAARRIKWLGRRSYAARFTRHQKPLLPVCIKAGALADGVPRRDLWLSPNHALHLDGVLIEARDLVNGASIVQPEATDTIEYFHIELDSHDVLIANGAAAESYIDDDNRALFHNAAEYRARCRDEKAPPARYCAPRSADGDAVERVRTRLAGRAGLPAEPRRRRFVARARLR